MGDRNEPDIEHFVFDRFCDDGLGTSWSASVYGRTLDESGSVYRARAAVLSL